MGELEIRVNTSNSDDPARRCKLETHINGEYMTIEGEDIADVVTRFYARAVHVLFESVNIRLK